MLHVHFFDGERDVETHEATHNEVTEDGRLLVKRGDELIVEYPHGEWSSVHNPGCACGVCHVKAAALGKGEPVEE